MSFFTDLLDAFLGGSETAPDSCAMHAGHSVVPTGDGLYASTEAALIFSPDDEPDWRSKESSIDDFLVGDDSLDDDDEDDE